MRTVKFIALLIVVFAVSIGNAYAQDDGVPAIDDGRVNFWSIGAPAVVYCHFAYPYAADPNAGVLDNIEVWGVNPVGYFEQALVISAADIDAAGIDPNTSTLLATGDGYRLFRETDGSLTVTAPPDFEGKTYWFNWTVGAATNC